MKHERPLTAVEELVMAGVEQAAIDIEHAAEDPIHGSAANAAMIWAASMLRDSINRELWVDDPPHIIQRALRRIGERRSAPGGG